MVSLPQLYTYFRSSAAYRVRIALNIKGIAYQPVFRHLVRNGGEHRQPDYLELNPDGLLPTFIHNGAVLTQSLAIIEYLEELYPEPRLLPGDAVARALIRSIALTIACDIHPINNLRVLQYLRAELHLEEEAVRRWYRHWVETGLKGIEARLQRLPGDGRHMVGHGVTMADLCLVPQMFNARRLHCDMALFPRLVEISAHLESLPEFAAAAPGVQPDGIGAT
jgi:maleylacetoacetate isomerase